MTKLEQIGLLKRDVRAWNALREECPIDFEVGDIYNEGFIGSDLTGADLRRFLGDLRAGAGAPRRPNKRSAKPRMAP